MKGKDAGGPALVRMSAGRDGRGALTREYRGGPGPHGVRLGQAIDLRIEGSSPSNDARYSLRSRFIFATMAA